MGIYLPTIDGDVITKWDKESVTEMCKMVKWSRIDYEQLTLFIYRSKLCNNYLFIIR